LSEYFEADVSNKVGAWRETARLIENLRESAMIFADLDSYQN
jgi:hypothetical protein